eukprot:3074701-Rhodomonas_salina.1
MDGPRWPRQTLRQRICHVVRPSALQKDHDRDVVQHQVLHVVPTCVDVSRLAFHKMGALFMLSTYPVTDFLESGSDA